jgi:transcriptional regulator GlxA family with amidase domain
MSLGRIANISIILAMIIYLMALNGLFDTGLATLLDAFALADDLSRSAGEASPGFAVTVVGVRRKVRTAHGLIVPVRPWKDLPRPDVVVVPALGAKTPETLPLALARKDVVDAFLPLRDWASRGAVAAAACTATFVLAEARLLDGMPATTSWWLSPLFRARYPKIRLDESRMTVDAGRCVTAGAALAHVDLALCLIRRFSPSLAALTARYLLVDSRPSQAAFIIPDQLMHSDPVVERFERWARSHLGKGFSLRAAALATGASERTLARRLRGALGKSPLSYFQDLRVECAAHLLRTTNASVEHIAARVGYADAATLRLLLKRRIGSSARELRRLEA